MHPFIEMHLFTYHILYINTSILIRPCSFFVYNENIVIKNIYRALKTLLHVYSFNIS